MTVIDLERMRRQPPTAEQQRHLGFREVRKRMTQAEKYEQAMREKRERERTTEPLGWDFDAFWRMYPHKVAKIHTQKVFERVAQSGKVSFADLMLGVSRYCAKTDLRPWCSAVVFLLQERWRESGIACGGAA